MGQRFDEIPTIQQNATRELGAIPKTGFSNCFQNWKKRWQQVVEFKGEYFEGCTAPDAKKMQNTSIFFNVVGFFPDGHRTYIYVLPSKNSTRIDTTKIAKKTAAKKRKTTIRISLPHRKFKRLNVESIRTQKKRSEEENYSRK